MITMLDIMLSSTTAKLITVSLKAILKNSDAALKHN